MSAARVVGSGFLIAGTAIGAGMLVFPTATGAAGFWPTLFMFLITAAFMFICLLYYLEVVLWFPTGSDIMSISEGVLGPIAKNISSIIYFLLWYSVLAAYIPGMAPLFSGMLSFFSLGEEHKWITELTFLLFGAFVIYIGTQWVDYVNRVLIIGLLIAFLLISGSFIPHFNSDMLIRSDSRYLWSAIPIAVAGFTAHMVIPAVRDYLKQDIKKIKISFAIGMGIPFVFYSLWVMIILGVIPLHGENGLIALSTVDQPTAVMVNSLSNGLSLTHFGFYVAAFSFFALVTSFLGVALSQFHFIMDTFQFNEAKLGRLHGVFYTFIPPLLISIYLSQNLRLLLGYAAILIMILFCIMVPIMVWKGRYRDKRVSTYRTPGGKPLIILTIATGILFIGLEIAQIVGAIPTISDLAVN